MSIAEALDISVQIASALSAAHKAGIIHRDIKPENIMLRPDGIVKVLDFGLAKLTEQKMYSADTEAPTIKANTDPGTILGTVNYMSPEQARGKPVDARSDIFSLGVVIYEMVAGRAPFEGETPSDLIASILKTEPPPLVRYSSDVSPELERIVTKALSKDREERYQTAKDLLIDLKRLRRQTDIDLEVGRYAPPEAGKKALAVTAGGAAAATANELLAQSNQAAVWPTSSAEYIVSGIKQHRKVAAVGLVLLLLGCVGLYLFLRPSPSANDITRQSKSISTLAVLPFVNESGNSDFEYLSDGMTESLINSLSQLPSLSVKARSTVFRYKGKEIGPQQVGSELNVQAVLNGRVVQRGDQLTLVLELVDTRTGNQIWGDQYNRKLTDLVTLQTEIARDVSSKLRVKLSGADEQKLVKTYTANTEAYQLYLKGRYFAGGKVTEEGLKKSIQYHQEAIEKDPNYALAYVGLAQSYMRLGHVWGFLPPQETFPKAKAAVMKALEIDETLADAHTALASYRLSYEWDWSGAERELKRAIDLNPNDASAHSDYGTYFQARGLFDEAIAERKLSRDLDPLSPTAIANVGYPYYFARQYDQAIEYYRKALELDPNYSWSYLWIGQAYLGKKMYEEAITEIKKAITLSEGNTRAVATLGYAYAIAGKHSEAHKVIGALQEESKHRYVSPYFIAVIYAGLGETDQAFAWLEKAYQERHPYLTLLKVEPVFDNLRSDPRFQDLLSRVGLPQI